MYLTHIGNGLACWCLAIVCIVCMGLDGMLKASPGAPGLSEQVFIGFGHGG